MSEDWSQEEVAAIVADYLRMLHLELDRQPYNKAEHNSHLQRLLPRRSRGAIEFKHANISAVLIELGFPYIDGYKPRYNYQELLRDEVARQLAADPGIAVLTQAIVEAPAAIIPAVPSINDLFVPPPHRESAPGVRERRTTTAGPSRSVNYLEREARNSSLGAAGEAFVLEIEQRRLWEAGLRRLAGKIEHVSKTRGDGLGYDIVSYETDGRERYIEVKTTAFGLMTPFFASAKEVACSESEGPKYSLYRLFRFRDNPRIFTVAGSLRQHFVLDAVQYRAAIPYKA